jgi:hypothetical protein
MDCLFSWARLRPYVDRASALAGIGGGVTRLGHPMTRRTVALTPTAERWPGAAPSRGLAEGPAEDAGKWADGGSRRCDRGPLAHPIRRQA